MSPYHLATRRKAKAKASLGTTAVITSIFVSLIFISLTLNGLDLKRATDFGTKRAVDFDKAYQRNKKRDVDDIL
jgi:hypothetical protein